MKTLIGKRIVKIRKMTPDEFDANGWDFLPWKPCVVIELDDGTLLYPSTDAEGNGSGEIFWTKGDEAGIVGAP